MSALPQAVPQEPACGACSGETYFDGDVYVCEDCQLCFDPNDDFSASFLDESLDSCGHTCDNWWHGANKIKQGLSFRCSPCQLPSGHASGHWTGCEAKPAGGVLGEEKP